MQDQFYSNDYRAVKLKQKFFHLSAVLFWKPRLPLYIAVVCLAKISMEDSACFKDALNRRVDLDLKKSFQTAGKACRPAIALTSEANTIRVWTQNIEMHLIKTYPKKTSFNLSVNLKLQQASLEWWQLTTQSLPKWYSG